MLKSIKKGIKITPFGIFSILFVCRIVVSLTYIQSIMAGKLNSDMLISVTIAFGLTLLFALPTILCVAKRKSPLKIKGLNWIYGANFIFLAALNVCRFSYFASARLNPDAKSWVFSVMIIAFSAYAAILGVQGISRFSSFAFCLIFGAIFVVLAFNVKNFSMLSIYPQSGSSVAEIMKNALSLSSNTAEIVVFLALADYIKSKKYTSFVASMSVSYFMLFLLMMFAVGVMGKAAIMQAFPIYSLSQLARIGNFSRLDVLYTGFWMFAIFVKTSVLIFCSSLCFEKFSHKTKCIASGIIVFALSLLLGNLVSVGNHSILLTVLPFVTTSTIIPLATLIFKKKSKGDKLLESF